MNTIGILNLLSFIFLILSVSILFYKFRGYFQKDTSIILIIISLLVLAFVTFTNITEHLMITNFFDMFEDEVEILFIPLFIFSIYSYCLKKELIINVEHEKRIRESNLMLKMSMEAANEALWVWSVDNQQLTIIEDNCFLKFKPFTYTIDNTNWKDIIHPNSFHRYVDMYEALVNEKSFPENVELQIRTDDNKYEWVLIRGQHVDNELLNRNITFSGTIIDISNFKQFQIELITAKTKAEESEQLKTAFLNNVSHEVRTPINAIVGFTNLLNDNDFSQNEKNEFMQIIVESSHKLLHVIDDIIHISQITVGTLQAVNKSFNVNDLLKGLQQTYLNVKKSSQIQLLYNSKSDIIINSDEAKIQKVIENLLDNSFKFTQSGFIEIGFSEESDNILFYVKDTGIGIDKEHHNAIFQNFRQVELTPTRLYGGPGLGLSICKGFVEFLGGKIWIDSELHKGTTVFFSIPKTQDLLMLRLNDETDKSLKDLKILIAEDEDSNFIYINELLKCKFKKVLRAKNGIDAIDLFKENQDIALILMDIKMPLMNGIDAAKEIRKINPRIPIIAQTAYTLSPVIANQINSFCDGYVLKPITRDALLSTLQNYIRNK
jgi:signal transduction histidine kinase/ActR/RegA family two-component response regulator